MTQKWMRNDFKPEFQEKMEALPWIAKRVMAWIDQYIGYTDLISMAKEGLNDPRYHDELADLKWFVIIAELPEKTPINKLKKVTIHAHLEANEWLGFTLWGEDEIYLAGGKS